MFDPAPMVRRGFLSSLGVFAAGSLLSREARARQVPTPIFPAAGVADCSTLAFPVERCGYLTFSDERITICRDGSFASTLSISVGRDYGRFWANSELKFTNVSNPNDWLIIPIWSSYFNAGKRTFTYPIPGSNPSLPGLYAGYVSGRLRVDSLHRCVYREFVGSPAEAPLLVPATCRPPRRRRFGFLCPKA